MQKGITTLLIRITYLSHSVWASRRCNQHDLDLDGSAWFELQQINIMLERLQKQWGRGHKKHDERVHNKCNIKINLYKRDTS